MYLLFLMVGFGLTYALLHFLFSFFFEDAGVRRVQDRISFFSMAGIMCLNLLVFLISHAVPDRELGNRVLHVFGGGFLAFLVCFLVVRDSGLRIGRFRFFVFSFLLTVALGVANELVEFLLQRYFWVVFAQTLTDTWLDLLSNVFGALIAAACLVPFVKSGKAARLDSQKRRA